MAALSQEELEGIANQSFVSKDIQKGFGVDEKQDSQGYVKLNNNDSPQITSLETPRTSDIRDMSAQRPSLPDNEFDSDGAIDNSLSMVEQQIGRARSDRENLVTRREDTQDDIIELSRGLESREDTWNSLRDQAGIDQAEERITTLDEQINSLTSAIQKGRIKDENDIESLAGRGEGLTASLVDRQQGELRRQRNTQRQTQAAELESLVATREAVSGSIDRARNAIERQMQLRFGDREQKIKNTQLALQYLDDEFVDNKQELERLYADQDRQLQEQKTEYKNATDLVFQAIQSGADPSRASRLLNDENLTQRQVIETFGNAFTPAGETFTLSEGQTRYDANGNVIAQNLDTSASDGAPVETSTFNAYLNDYVQNGKISNIPENIRNQVLSAAENYEYEDGTIIDKLTGLPGNVNSTAKSEILTRNDILQRARNLQELFNSTGDEKGLNTFQRNFSRRGFNQFNETEQSYQEARDDFVDLLGRERTGAVIGDAELRQFQKMVPGLRWDKPGGISDKEKLDNLVDRLQTDLENAKEANNVDIVGEITSSEEQRLQELESKASDEQLNSLSSANIQIGSNARLATVNNNPGNLRFANQPGATVGEGGFARFSSPGEGIAALERQIDLDARRGNTLASFVSKYAPPNENDTEQYIQQVMQQTGANRNTPISQIDRNLLTKAIAKKESSTKIFT